jgi:hypothetical protein
MKPSSYAPMYCALYPQLAEISRKHGYAMAVHGSLQRDMDLICIPWVDQPSEPKAVVDEIVSTFAIRTIGEPDTTFHGRERWTVSVGFGECFIDLSFMPRAESAIAAKMVKVAKGAGVQKDML